MGRPGGVSRHGLTAHYVVVKKAITKRVDAAITEAECPMPIQEILAAEAVTDLGVATTLTIVNVQPTDNTDQIWLKSPRVIQTGKNVTVAAMLRLHVLVKKME